MFSIPLIFFNLSKQKTRHLNFVNSTDQKIDEKIWKTRELLFDRKFYIYTEGTIADVTPIRKTTSSISNPFTAYRRYDIININDLKI